MVINNAIIKMEATALFITSVAQRIMAKDRMARTSWPLCGRPCGVGRKATTKPTAIAMANQVNLNLVLVAGTGGEATTEVLIVSHPTKTGRMRARTTSRLATERSGPHRRPGLPRRFRGGRKEVHDIGGGPHAAKYVTECQQSRVVQLDAHVGARVLGDDHVE